MRAAASVAPNIAESRMTGEAGGKQHYLRGGPDQQARLRRVGAMLNGLR